ncbi:hypothetical protein [Undibacterium sp.]|uniref:hypothetical protein n=1 Tax=Undibacterium sp. TaxID=1914977 RepID=UPI00374D52EC
MRGSRIWWISTSARRPTLPLLEQAGIGDKLVRNGLVSDGASTDQNVIGVRRFFDLMPANPRLSAAALQTSDSKG